MRRLLQIATVVLALLSRATAQHPATPQQHTSQTVAALIQTAVANAAVNAGSAYEFTFHEDYVSLGTRVFSSTQYELLFVEGVPYRRLVGINGSSLSRQKAVEESKRYDLAVATIHAMSPEQRRQMANPGQSQAYNSLLTDPDRLLSLYDCKFAGHQYVVNRLATMVRCTLRHNAPQAAPQSDPAAVPLGKELPLWIDDRKPFISRVRTWFDHAFGPYGAGSTVTTTWKLIDGVWLQTSTEFSWIGAENPAFKGMDIDTFSRFKRFRTGSFLLIPANPNIIEFPLPSEH